jgi:hypothetical protein
MADNRDRRAYYLANKEKIDARNRAYRLANPEKVKTARAAYWKVYAERIKKQKPEKPVVEFKTPESIRASVRKYRNKKRHSDPAYKIREQQKNRINCATLTKSSKRSSKDRKRNMANQVQSNVRMWEIGEESAFTSMFSSFSLKVCFNSRA